MSSKSPYSGIEREAIPWYPAIDADTCTGCGECFEFCSNNVFEMMDGQSVVKNPYNCVVGCSSCAKFCPVDSLSFPTKEALLASLDELRKNP